MEVPRLSMDALSLARAVLRAAGDSLAQIQSRPRVETAVKFSGGVAAVLLALKYAKSLRSSCFVGLITGVFAHSLYADVLRKKPPVLVLSASESSLVDSLQDDLIETVLEEVAIQDERLDATPSSSSR